MASENDDVATAVITSTGATVAERTGYIPETAVLRMVTNSVTSTHTAAPGTNVTYISGCGCCGQDCRVAPCTQSANGYAPYAVLLDWDNSPGGSPLYNKIVQWEITLPFYNSYGFAPTLKSNGDCSWHGWVRQDYFTSGGVTYYFVVYGKLYYDTGWKFYLDLANYAGGVPPPEDYVASGNQVVFDLDNPFDVSGVSQYIPITLLSEAGSPLVTTWNGILPYGGPGSYNALPSNLIIATCGNPVVTVDCCTETIPRRLIITFIGCPDIEHASPYWGAYIGGIPLDWNGTYWYTTYTTRVETILLNYEFRLYCDSGNWRLDIYDFVSSSIVYSDNSTADICYPIYLEFDSGSFHFVHGGSGSTDYCNGVPFTMVLTS